MELELKKDEHRTHSPVEEVAIVEVCVVVSPETFPAWAGRAEQTRKSRNTRRNNHIVFFG